MRDALSIAGLKGNVVLYTSLMTVCHKGGQPGRAMVIFRTMEGEGLQADVVRPLLASCAWRSICPKIMSCKYWHASEMRADGMHGRLPEAGGLSPAGKYGWQTARQRPAAAGCRLSMQAFMS